MQSIIQIRSSTCLKVTGYFLHIDTGHWDAFVWTLLENLIMSARLSVYLSERLRCYTPLGCFFSQMENMRQRQNNTLLQTAMTKDAHVTGSEIPAS